MADARVFVLAGRRPRVTSAYLINRLAHDGMVDGIITVEPPGTAAAVARAYRIQRRRGWAALAERWRAKRLRTRLLDGYRETHLVRELFRTGVAALDLPDGFPVIHAGQLESSDTVRTVAELNPRLLVQAGAGWVKRPLLDIPQMGTLSLHHGIMPLIRGMDSILWGCVEKRPEWIGITVQLLAESLDQGQIVNQACIRAAESKNPFTIIAEATILGADLMVASIEQALDGRLMTFSPGSEGTTYRSALTRSAVRDVYELCSKNGRTVSVR